MSESLRFLCLLGAASFWIGTATGQESTDGQTPASQSQSPQNGPPFVAPTTLPLARAFAKDEWRIWTSPFRRAATARTPLRNT